MDAFPRVLALSTSTCTSRCVPATSPATSASALSCVAHLLRSTSPVSPPGSTWTPSGSRALPYGSSGVGTPGRRSSSSPSSGPSSTSLDAFDTLLSTGTSSAGLTGGSCGLSADLVGPGRSAFGFSASPVFSSTTGLAVWGFWVMTDMRRVLTPLLSSSWLLAVLRAAVNAPSRPRGLSVRALGLSTLARPFSSSISPPLTSSPVATLWLAATSWTSPPVNFGYRVVVPNIMKSEISFFVV